MASLSAQTLADLEQPRDAQISPDAKYATYVTQTSSRAESAPKTKIWLAEVGKENSSRAWTRGDHHDASPSFSPDSKQIAFLSDRGGNKDDLDLYYLSISQSEIVKKAISVSGYGSVESFRWNRKGDKIALCIRLADTGSDIKVHGENIRYRNLWLLDVESGELERLNNEKLDITSFEWNLEDTEIVYCTTKTTDNESSDYGQEIKTINVNDKKPKLLSRKNHRVFSVVYSDDGLLMHSNYHMRGNNHAGAIFRWNGDDFETIAFGETNDAAALQMSAGKPLFLVLEKMRTQIRTFDETLYDVAHNVWPYFGGVIGYGKTTLVFIKDSVGVPPDVYSLVNGEECKLSQHGERISQMNIAKGHIVEYEEEDIPYNACYTVPTSLQENFEAKKPSPTVVVVHGGPYSRSTDEWDTTVILRLPAYLAAIGYLVLTPNYRGGVGHGDDYAASVLGQPEISYKDVAWLVKKGIEEGRIDKDCVAICGWSQGGFMTYQAVSEDANLHFTAAMAGAGVSDWYVTAAAADITKIEATYLGYSLWDSEVAPAKLKRTNPIHGAKHVRTPLLMIHGEDDSRVSQLNAVVFSKALKALGKEFEMAIYPREGHGAWPRVFERAHYIDILERTARFFEKHLGKP